MLPTFETVRLILKPRTIDDLESCIEMDIAPQVTEYIPGEWNGSYEHLTFLKERILKSYPSGLGYWSIFSKEIDGFYHYFSKKRTAIRWR